MAKIFEAFLRNFYGHEQTAYCVRSEVMAWDAEPTDAASFALLPRMETDITLRSTERTRVIDAKYYRDALSGKHGSVRLRSTHLYQLFT
jgi:5-methylcytosine-specific restriction enzyme subunit McrC